MGQSLVEDSQNFTWSILEYFAPYDVYVQCIIKVTVSFCLALFFYKIILLRRKDLFDLITYQPQNLMKLLNLLRPNLIFPNIATTMTIYSVLHKTAIF